MGTGGVGGYFGARLAQAGNDVAFVARGRAPCRDARPRTAVESATGDIALRAASTATDDPASLAPVDVVMFASSCGTSSKARRRSRRSSRGAASSFRSRTASRASTSSRASSAPIACWAASPTSRRRSARPASSRTSARWRACVSAVRRVAQRSRAQAFVDACAARGHRRRALAPDIRRALWEKFVFLAAFSGLTCLARQPLGVVRGDPDLRATFEAAMRETMAVGGAKGIALADDFVARQLRALDALPAEMRASMLNDLSAGQSPRSAVALRRVSRSCVARGASRHPSTRRSTRR